VEGDCHFLEFPPPKTHAVRCAAEPAGQTGEPGQATAQLSTSATFGSALAAAAATRGAAHRDNRLGDRRATQAANLGTAAMRQGRRHQARRQAIARGKAIERQVRLYCFRLGNCGTFMPLFCVRGMSRIAVVWTLFAAVFSAVAPVPFRVVSTHAAVLSAVDHR
jgi:hypothetical protein